MFRQFNIARAARYAGPVRRIAVIATFVATALDLWIGAHVYVVRRLLLEPRLPEGIGDALLGIVVLLAAGAPLLPLAERRVPARAARWLAWPTSLWMGLFFYLLLGTLATDLLWSVLGAGGPHPSGPAAGRLRAMVVFGAAALVAGTGLREALRPPAVRRLEITLPRWPAALDGLRIVQISDLHIGPILGRRFAADVTQRVNALAADLVVITGDLVDGSVAHLADEVAPLAGLRGRHGVFFAIGNHDTYSGADAWAAQATRLGWQVLRNRRVRLRAGTAEFELAGVDDHRAQLVNPLFREDLPRTLAGRNPELPLLLLAHDPATFARASQMGIDLQISGHTHGGQIWPFVHLVRIAIPWVAGLYERHGAHLYVSRGTGFWGPPMRVRAPAEITLLVLRAAAPQPP